MKMRAFLLAPAFLLAMACASTSDVDKLQDQVAELQEELAGMKRTSAVKEDVQNVNLRIAEQTEQLLRSNATLIAKVDQIEERVQNTQGAIEQTNYRLDRFGQQVTETQRNLEALRAGVAAPPLTPGMPGTAPVSEVTVAAPQASVENPLDLYNAAYRDYQRGNFDLAIAGFQEYLRDNASSDLADNAAYWIGESLFSQKKYREAIAQFDDVVNRYSRSDKVPGSLLKKGFSYISLGERAQGIVQLQYVVHEHPTSQESALARQRLRQLGVETR